MRGVSFAGDRTIEILSVPDPVPGPRDVVISIKASGVCGSDLKFYRAPKNGGLEALGLRPSEGPVIAGHEPCGVIEAVGTEIDSANWRVGDRVMVHHYHGCETCSP